MSNSSEDTIPVDRTNLPLQKNESTELAASQAEIKIKYPPVHWKETQTLISQMEEKLHGKVLVYYVAVDTYMDKLDVDYFYSHLKNIGPQDKLNLLLFTPGGNPLTALRIANLLYSYTNSLSILVPGICASTGTLLALAASRIIMGPAGFLTAVDTSVNSPLNPKGFDGKPVTVEIEQIRKVVSLMKNSGSTNIYESLFQYIHPVVVGNIERAVSLSRKVATEILSLHMENRDEINEIARKLDEDFPSHGYPITFKDAQNIHLPAEKADTELSDLMWSIIRLYAQVVRPATTNFSTTNRHIERTPVLIESAGRRTFNAIKVNYIKDAQGWIKDHSEGLWLSAFEKEINGESKLTFSQIDI